MSQIIYLNYGRKWTPEEIHMFKLSRHNVTFSLFLLDLFVFIRVSGIMGGITFDKIDFVVQYPYALLLAGLLVCWRSASA